MSLSKTAELLFEGVMASINTAMICSVISFDEVNCTAKIQPLFQKKDGKTGEYITLQPIEDVPVLYQRYKVRNYGETYEMMPILEKDDLVQVVFNQRSIDEALEGKVHFPGISRRFSTHDAVVVGVFKT